MVGSPPDRRLTVQAGLRLAFFLSRLRLSEIELAPTHLFLPSEQTHGVKRIGPVETSRRDNNGPGNRLRSLKESCSALRTKGMVDPTAFITDAAPISRCAQYDDSRFRITRAPREGTAGAAAT